MTDHMEGALAHWEARRCGEEQEETSKGYFSTGHKRPHFSQQESENLGQVASGSSASFPIAPLLCPADSIVSVF